MNMYIVYLVSWFKQIGKKKCEEYTSRYFVDILVFHKDLSSALVKNCLHFNDKFFHLLCALALACRTPILSMHMCFVHVNEQLL